MLNRRGRLVVGLGAVLMLAAGCGVETSPAASTGSLRIVTAFYPLQFVAERVAGDRAQVTSLTEPGAEPHDLELKPKQIADLTEADLVIYEKTFQSAVDQGVSQSGNDQILDVTSVVPLQPLATEEDDHADEEHAEDDGHDHGETGLDPHIWLNPANMITITDAVRARLSEVDPEHATDYRTRADALTQELQTIDTAYAKGLKTCQRRDFITTHAAFGYLATRYDLHQIGINGLSADAEASPARIAEVQKLARDHGVTTIFSETLVSPALAESIAGDLGLVTDVLDPIEGITSQSRGQDYVAVMTTNLDALRKANGCQ